ncbi:MAG: class I SAM-dependent methyltransferase [Chloroflexota bacterium]
MSSDTLNTPNPWLSSRTRTGAEYDAPYEARARAGIDIHGEANLVEKLLIEYQFEGSHTSILDAGCGTGRMAIELARRGYDIVGVDLDDVMLSQAQAKAPELTWILADLNHVTFEQQFEVIVLAGNVMIYLTPKTEETVLVNLNHYLKPQGLLIAAFELKTPSWSQLTLDTYERITASVGLTPMARWSTWDQDPWQTGDSYIVSLHRKG